MIKLNELTLLDALAGLKRGEFSSVDLLNACYEQIEKQDTTISAFITVLPRDDLLKQAEKADKKIKENGPVIFEEKPLLGIPYACKDNFNTKGIQTTASSNILKGYISPYESTVTRKLKEAGAMVLGKTNMDAFAHGSSTETSDFFTTKNPWNLDRVPGGSSGGSGAALATHMCIFAVGSETAGSIRGPAAWCGLTGLKPTYGRVSRYGLIAMTSSTDVPGVLTKDVSDAAYLLEILAGKDPLDATSSDRPVEKYTDKLNAVAFSNLKIGKPKKYFGKDTQDGVNEAVEKALQEFVQLGATVIDLDLMDPKYTISVYTIIQRSEVSSNLARFDGIRFGHPRDSFGSEAKKRIMHGAYTLSAGYYDQYYAKAQKARTLIVEDFKKAYEKVDLIAGPSMPCVALKLGESSKDPMFGEMMDILAEPSAIAGLTAISIPCGFSEKLPVGLQLIAPQFQESLVLAAAKRFQEETDFHTKFPKMEA